MARKGGNKKACDAYKNSGRYFTNKDLKQARDKKLKEKFAKRREAGKAYEYKKNPFEPGSEDYILEENKRRCKNVDRRDEYSKMKSIMRVLQNQLDQEAKSAALRKKNSKRAGKESES